MWGSYCFCPNILFTLAIFNIVIKCANFQLEQELQRDVQLCGVTQGERTEPHIQPRPSVLVFYFFLDKDCFDNLSFLLLHICISKPVSKSIIDRGN